MFSEAVCGGWAGGLGIILSFSFVYLVPVLLSNHSIPGSSTGKGSGGRGEESEAVSLEILLLCVCSGLVPQGQCRKLVSPLQLPNLVISPEGWYFIQSAEQKASMENLTPIHAFRWAADLQRFL